MVSITVGPLLATCLEPLVQTQNLITLSFFCRYYFEWCSSEVTELVSFPYFCESSSHNCKRLMIFLSPFYVDSLIPSRAKFWNSLPTKCFPLIYDLIDFKFLQLIVTCCLWTLSNQLSYTFHLCLSFLVTLCLAMALHSLSPN